ncbi:MAG: tetratricopeptide repeat protein [Bacteroidia bacterium]
MENKLETELSLIERALRAEQFRLIIVQYNHHSAIDELRLRLKTVFPTRNLYELDALKDGSAGILQFLQEPPSGFLVIQHIVELLNDISFTRSFNQRRDGLSKYQFGLILLLPIGGDYLHRLARTMPDLWSLRNLVAELDVEPQEISDITFITDNGKRYAGFASLEEARYELDVLQKRINDIDTLPGSRNLLATLHNRIGKIHLQLSEYKLAEKAFQLALEIARETQSSQAEAVALAELGDVHYYQGELERAREYLEKSLSISREIGDKSGEGESLNTISQIYAARGDYKTALWYLEESLKISREIGDKIIEGTILNNIGQVYKDLGDYRLAQKYLLESLSIVRKIGYHLGEARTLNNIGGIYMIKGDEFTSVTLKYLEESLSIQRKIGDKSGEGTTLNNLGQIYRAKGDSDSASKYLEQSLSLRREIGDINGTAVTLSNLGGIILENQKSPEKALPFFLEAQSIFRKIGSPNMKSPENYLHQIRTQIGEARFQEIVNQQNL